MFLFVKIVFPVQNVALRSPAFPFTIRIVVISVETVLKNALKGRDRLIINDF